MVTTEEAQAFFNAVAKGTSGALACLIKADGKGPAFVKCLNDQGENALHILGRSEMPPQMAIERILTFSAEILNEVINQQDGRGRTPLASCCAEGMHPIAVKKILEQSKIPVDINQRDAEEYNPLMLAIRSETTNDAGQQEIVVLLLKAGVDLKPKDKEGYNAIHHGVQSGKSHVLASLLAHCKDRSLVNVAGGPKKMTPLHIIVTKKNVNDETRSTIAKALVDAQAEPSLPDKDGKTAFDLAKSLGRQHLVKLFTPLMVNKECGRGIKRSNDALDGMANGSSGRGERKRGRKECKRLRLWEEKIHQLQQARIKVEGQIEERQELKNEAVSLHDSARKMNEDAVEIETKANEKVADVGAREKAVELREKDLATLAAKISEQKAALEKMKEELDNRRVLLYSNEEVYNERLSRLQRGEEDLALKGAQLDLRTQKVREALSKLNYQSGELAKKDHAVKAQVEKHNHEYMVKRAQLQTWRNSSQQRLQQQTETERKRLLDGWERLAKVVHCFGEVANLIREHQASGTPLPPHPTLPDVAVVVRQFEEAYDVAMISINHPVVTAPPQQQQQQPNQHPSGGGGGTAAATGGGGGGEEKVKIAIGGGSSGGGGGVARTKTILLSAGRPMQTLTTGVQQQQQGGGIGARLSGPIQKQQQPGGGGGQQQQQQQQRQYTQRSQPEVGNRHQPRGAVVAPTVGNVRGQSPRVFQANGIHGGSIPAGFHLQPANINTSTSPTAASLTTTNGGPPSLSVTNEAATPTLAPSPTTAATAAIATPPPAPPPASSSSAAIDVDDNDDDDEDNKFNLPMPGEPRVRKPVKQPVEQAVVDLSED